MTAPESDSSDDEPASELIDAIINAIGDWRSATLARLRASIKNADPAVVEEVKWKKPSRPMGTPVWSHDGIICIGEALKSAVRLTFPKGLSSGTRISFSILGWTAKACAPSMSAKATLLTVLH